MKSKHVDFSVLVAVAALTTGPASAENACKGLSETACAAAPGCGWTKGYTRKDGREVAPYCRVKGKPKTADAASQEKRVATQATPKG